MTSARGSETSVNGVPLELTDLGDLPPDDERLKTLRESGLSAVEAGKKLAEFIRGTSFDVDALRRD